MNYCWLWVPTIMKQCDSVVEESNIWTIGSQTLLRKRMRLYVEGSGNQTTYGHARWCKLYDWVSLYYKWQGRATGRAGRGVALHSKNDIVPLTKTFVIYVAGPYKLYSNNYTTDIIITAILGSAMGHKTRKCCDCVVRWSEVWTWLHR